MSVLLGLLVGACGIVGPDEYRRVIGVIRGDGRYVSAVPDSVLVGEWFTFSFHTHGYYDDRKGETHVKMQGNIATITPYDYYHRNRKPIAPFISFRHETGVRFLEAGEAQVILRARARVGRSLIVGRDTIEVKQTMHVYSR